MSTAPIAAKLKHYLARKTHSLIDLSSNSATFKEGKDPLHIFLHGIQGSKELFLPLIEQPSFRGKAILLLDFPGFGGNHSDSGTDYSIGAFAQFVEKILTGAPMRPIVLVGHSLGGMVATALIGSALNIKAVISLEGNLTLEDCGASNEIAAISFVEFETNYLPKLLESLANSQETSAAFRLDALKRADPRAVYRVACSIVKESSSNNLLKSLATSTIPTMLLVGDKSSFGTRKLPGKTKVATIPDASHFMLHDNLAAVLTAIETFLNEL